MSGQYLKRKHFCCPPPVRGHGDLWQCECDKIYRSSSPGNPNYDRWMRVYWLGRLLRGIK